MIRQFFIVCTCFVLVTSCSSQEVTSDTPLQTTYFLGSENASIVMEVYSDYECPACAYFEKNIFPDIQKNLIDTGKIKYVYHHFPLPQHRDAFVASQAAYCAGDQEKYWEMHQMLFAHQTKLYPAALREYAHNIGVQEEAFMNCLQKKKYETSVRSSVQMALDKQIDATPTIFLNGMKVSSGITSYEDIQKIISKLIQQ